MDEPKANRKGNAKNRTKVFFSRLYFTDSGHYLLSTTDFTKDNHRDQHFLRQAVRRYFTGILKLPASTSSSGAGSLALLNSVPEELNGESSIEFDIEFGSSEPPPETGTYHGILHPEPRERDQHCPGLHERKFQTAIPNLQEPQQPNGTYLNGDILNHEIFAQRKHFSKAAIALLQCLAFLRTRRTLQGRRLATDLGHQADQGCRHILRKHA